MRATSIERYQRIARILVLQERKSRFYTAPAPGHCALCGFELGEMSPCIDVKLDFITATVSFDRLGWMFPRELFLNPTEEKLQEVLQTRRPYDWETMLSWLSNEGTVVKTYNTRGNAFSVTKDGEIFLYKGKPSSLSLLKYANRERVFMTRNHKEDSDA